MPRHLKPAIRTRTATLADLDAVCGLLGHARMKAAGARCVFPYSPRKPEKILRERILDRCMIVVTRGETLLAAASLDLDRSELGELLFLPGADGLDLFETVITRIEQLAVQFGFRRLEIRATAACRKPLIAAGYHAEVGNRGDALVLRRSLARRLTHYARRIQAIGETLGIPSDYGQRHRLSLHAEATRLESIGPDIFGRDQRLAPRAAASWQRMRRAALASGIDLQAVSAFRSVDYQQGLLQRKLSKGQVIEDILKVSAAPGYSEHHSGRAIDVTTPGFAALEESFEKSPAFAWLVQHARGFGFSLSFPRGNRHGLAAEPWHWCWRSSPLA